MSVPDDPTSEEGGLRGVVDDLYRLEPSGFTAARAAHAAEARRGGDRELAKQISKLPRPSRAAYALNLLARERPGDMDRLLQLAGSLRDASKRLAGSELRELGGSRQQMIAELTSTASRLAAENGAPVTGPTVEEIEESLQASLLDDKAAHAVTSGRLARPLRVAAIGTAELSEALPAVSLEPPGGRGGRRPPESRSRKAPFVKPSAGDAAEKAAAGRLEEAEESARRAAKAAGAARTEVERARRARDRAVTRRQSAEAALVSARREELSSSKALKAAEVAHRRSESALEGAERSRRQVVERAGDGRRD